MGKSDTLVNVLDATGVVRLLTSIKTWHGTLVLNYHRIASSEWDHTGIWSATVDELDAQLRYLAGRIEFTGPEALLGSRKRRDRSVMITFDDGYRETYDLALPLLRKYGVPAIFFLTTGFIDGCAVAWWHEIAQMIQQTHETVIPGEPWFHADIPVSGPADRQDAISRLLDRYRELPWDRTELFLEWLAESTGTSRLRPAECAPDWITWDMARELHAAGMSIGGHTVNHPVLARLPLEGQRREIQGCLERLRDELGVPIELFAYPVGLRDTFDAGTVSCLREAGVRLSFSYHGGYVSANRRDPYDVPRTSVWLGMGAARFRALTALPQAFARW